MADNINPDHYKRLPAEAIEIIEAMIEGAPDNKSAYLHGQAAKYDLRLWEKGKSLEDFLSDWGKHIWYALRLESHLLDLIEKQKADEKQKASELQSLKDYPFGKLKTASLNSDTIPEGYRKLNDSSEEPRQLGDLRWSVAEKRYIEISVDEIGYANRDNWAACRKVEPVIKQSSTTDSPDGWRFLEVGEVIRKGDKYRDLKSQTWIEVVGAVGDSLQDFHKPTIRRNRFEVGEKVVRVSGECVYEITAILDEDYYEMKTPSGFSMRLYAIDLAPYIEETK